MQPVRQAVESLLLRGCFSGCVQVTGTCNELYQYRQRLWVFLDYDEVEPTNNAAERALRPFVICDKLSFGTQSVEGSRFMETMLSIIETCRQQKRNLFAFITSAINAAYAKRPIPKLLNL